MIADAKSGSGLERFSGETYIMWKGKLLTHVNQLDHQYQTKRLEKMQPEAKVLIADFLRSNSEEAPSPTTEDDEQKVLRMRVKPTAINTIKTVVTEGSQRLNEDGKTLEACAEDEVMADIESLDPAHYEGFEDNGNSAHTPIRSPQSMEVIEQEAEL
ncbi:Hypothetical protein PHPALM_36608 [Phytophthora palmivora]|uniref:Uncharacterized protein n=1 Tax=Phytophthora palmivora TaxID=4796 RepID=A0A2P4WZI7_9STRA|nr:Hypothetical protein PHPALM_36608 [Phytophthora palmivora]